MELSTTDFFISKYVDFLVDGYTKVLESIPKIINLLHTVTVINKLRTICGCLHSTMFLRIPIHLVFMDQVKYTFIGTAIAIVTE